MSKKPFIDAQTKEDEFFYKRDQELIQAMRQKAETEAALHNLSAVTGIADRDVLSALQQVGYDPDTGILLQFMPLVQVAWSDGSVSEEERKQILHIAAQKGVRNDRAWTRLVEFLQTEPSEAVFRVTLRALRESNEALPLKDRGRREFELLMQCLSIASSSGGVFGLGSKISAAEESTLNRILGALADEPPLAQAEAQER